MKLDKNNIIFIFYIVHLKLLNKNVKFNKTIRIYPLLKFLWKEWLDELVQKQEEKRKIDKVHRFYSQWISGLSNIRVNKTQFNILYIPNYIFN